VQAFLVLGADVLGGIATTRSPSPEARALAPTHLCISRDRARTRRRRRLDGDDPRIRGPSCGARVCLGHQSIVEVFGGEVVRAGRLMPRQGLAGSITTNASSAGLPQPFAAGRYQLADRRPGIVAAASQ